MTKYYIYQELIKDRKTKKDYLHNIYYRQKVKETEALKFVGEATLSDDYFIVGCQTQYSDIIDLNDIELEYSATLKDDTISNFKHSIQDLLTKAKEGILPYISFAEYKVSKKPRIVIKGKLHTIKSQAELTVLEGY